MKLRRKKARRYIYIYIYIYTRAGKERVKGSTCLREITHLGKEGVGKGAGVQEGRSQGGRP